MGLFNKQPKDMIVAEKKSVESPWIDDTFRIEQKRWGTWTSYDKDENALVSALTKELCAEATRFYLKGKQEGFPEPGSSYTGTVGGKL